MLKKILFFSLIFISLFIVDQYIKLLFVNGYEKEFDCISLILEYNTGVAFSMFSFLAQYLKYIKIIFVFSGVMYLNFNREIFRNFYIPLALLFTGAISNIYDRFIHIGVVDYIYWHCGFNFAIFNFADILINIAVVWIVIINYRK